VDLAIFTDRVKEYESETGIGYFLDDLMHKEILGLQNNTYQSLYHFTVGCGYVDSRIQKKLQK